MLPCHRGHQARYDEAASVHYPVFRVQPCAHQRMVVVEQVLGRRFANREFATFVTNQGNWAAFQAAWGYVETYQPGRTERGLCFSGSTGVGKTHLAASILREVVRRGETSFRWVVCPEHEGDFAQLAGIRFLVLDDLTELAFGAGYQKHQSKRELFALVNRRYEGLLPTVVTSRLDEAGLKTTLGDELTGRLLDICTHTVVGGKSWRGV